MMTPDAVDVLRARYLKRDERGQITETPAEMFHRVAERLATTRGPYPEFADSRQAKAGAAPLRNATRTAIAPTGTLSLIAG